MILLGILNCILPSGLSSHFKSRSVCIGISCFILVTCCHVCLLFSLLLSFFTSRFKNVALLFPFSSLPLVFIVVVSPALSSSDSSLLFNFIQLSFLWLWVWFLTLIFVDEIINCTNIFRNKISKAVIPLRESQIQRASGRMCSGFLMDTLLRFLSKWTILQSEKLKLWIIVFRRYIIWDVYDIQIFGGYIFF